MGVIQGSGIDSDLNATGQAQAEAFYKRYRDVPFDKVYTSALKRTHQSVKRFIDRGIPWEQYAGLNEISWGHSEGRASTPMGDAAFYGAIRRWQRGDTKAGVPGGESPEDVVIRQNLVLDIIFNRPEEKNILVCMHGRAIRVLLCTLTGVSLRMMDTFEHRNLCLYVLSYNGSLPCTIELANSVASDDS